MMVDLTNEELALLGQALAGLSTHVSTVCDSFAGSDPKYNAAHEYFKGKRDAVAALHVKVIQAKVG